MGNKTDSAKLSKHEQVTTGRTGHAEVVQVEYDPAKVSYAKLVEAFWRNIDPTQRNGQFCDHAPQYKFYKTGCGRDARLQQLWGKSGG